MNLRPGQQGVASRLVGSLIPTRERNMICRKFVVALALLCALVLSAVSVAGASATEAVECGSSASKIDKFGAHCLSVPEGKTANFGHIGLSAGSHAITAT